MKYYSSMTLADYVATNWLEMDPNLVTIIEKEERLLDEAQEEAEAWHENYHEVLDNAIRFRRDLVQLIDQYVGARMSFDDFLTEIKMVVDEVEFEQ